MRGVGRFTCDASAAERDSGNNSERTWKGKHLNITLPD